MAGAWGSQADLPEKAFDAVRRGDLETLQETVNSGLDLNEKDYIDNALLHSAARNGRLEVVEYLIGREALVDVLGYQDHTPLHLAAEYGHHAVVEYLIGKGAFVNARNIDHCTPLHLGTSEKVCRILVESGADMEAVDLHLWRPLHHAVMQNEEEKITYLLKMGADVTSKDINGDTPCHVAAGFDKLDLLQILLPHVEENLCNGQNQTVYDLINQHYTTPKDSEEFTDLLNQFEVLKADRVMLHELPKPLRMEKDVLLQYRDDISTDNFEEEDLVTRDEAEKILNELEETSVEAKEKYLKALLERFAHPRDYWTTSGQNGYDLAIRVQEFVNFFLGEAAKIDTRFAGTLELVGSCGDRTRLGQPKEFDFFLAIQDLSNKQSFKSSTWDFGGDNRIFVEPTPNIEEGDMKGCLTVKDIQKRWNNFLDNRDKLDEPSVHGYFFNLLRETSRRLESFTKFDFSFRKGFQPILYSHNRYFRTQHTVPLVRPMKAGCTLRLRCLKTGLLIDVDVVPGIKFQGWPDRDHLVIPFDEMRKVVPPSVEDGEIGYCIVPKSRQWELSFVTLEKMILSHTEEPLLDVLKILKILNALVNVYPSRIVLSDYLMKTAFLSYLASTKHVPGDDLSLPERVVAILKNFCGNIFQSPIYSFFLPELELWDPALGSLATKEFERLIHRLVSASPPTERNTKEKEEVCSLF